MARFTFPSNYDTAEEIIVPINIALIPYVSGALRIFEKSYTWASDEDYERGYNAFVELQSYMSGRTVRDIVEAIDRQYRLLDTTFNGTEYSSAENPADPTRVIVSPPIPYTPPPVSVERTALRAHVARLHQLAENAATGAESASGSAMDGTVGLDYDGSWRARLAALQGEINEGWFGIGGQQATLADITTALRIGRPEDAAQIDTVLEALSAGSSAASIFDLVRELLGDAVNTGLEGGVLAVLIASSIANAGMLGSLAGQLDALTQRLDRVAAALDGGEVPAPSNVIAELDAIKTMVS